MPRRFVSSPSYKAAIATIIAARKERGVSQAELAQRLGKHPSFIAKIEISERRCDVAEFVAIARALGFDESELMRRVGLALRDPVVI
jgi:transcriptional regulator with XRE-family HTH domain